MLGIKRRLTLAINRYTLLATSLKLSEPSAFITVKQWNTLHESNVCLPLKSRILELHGILVISYWRLYFTDCKAGLDFTKNPDFYCDDMTFCELRVSYGTVQCFSPSILHCLLPSSKGIGNNVHYIFCKFKCAKCKLTEWLCLDWYQNTGIISLIMLIHNHTWEKCLGTSTLRLQSLSYLESLWKAQLIN